MTNFKGFASLVLAAAIVSTLSAETHCPGNAASVPLRIVNRYQIIVPVFVNHSGPYNFILDTGAEVTIVDSSLAAELRLGTQGPAEIVSAGLRESSALAQLDQIAVGTHTLADQQVLVYDLGRLHSAELPVRGILAVDVLGHFDLLIDNVHKMLCLDDSAAMRAGVKRPHIPLIMPAGTADGAQAHSSFILSVRLPGGIRPVLLKLDSGTNGAFLYNTAQCLGRVMFLGTSLQGRSVDGSQRTFSILPPEDVIIGPLELPKVAFVTLAGAQKDSRTAAFDGLLPTNFFRLVFIDHADHVAVLDPW